MWHKKGCVVYFSKNTIDGAIHLHKHSFTQIMDSCMIFLSYFDIVKCLIHAFLWCYQPWPHKCSMWCIQSFIFALLFCFFQVSRCHDRWAAARSAPKTVQKRPSDPQRQITVSARVGRPPQRIIQCTCVVGKEHGGENCLNTHTHATCVCSYRFVWFILSLCFHRTEPCLMTILFWLKWGRMKTDDLDLTLRCGFFIVQLYDYTVYKLKLNVLICKCKFWMYVYYKSIFWMLFIYLTDRWIADEITCQCAIKGLASIYDNL